MQHVVDIWLRVDRLRGQPVLRADARAGLLRGLEQPLRGRQRVKLRAVRAARRLLVEIWQGRGLHSHDGRAGLLLCGLYGEAPELLDELAFEFRAGGWSVKKLIRRIVTSATYRQSSRIRPELLSRDPDNILLARQARSRVPAELIRDVTLAASGLLNPA